MILIASRQDDGSTLFVIEWLNAMKKQFVRINTDDNRTFFSHYDPDLNVLAIKQGEKEINLLTTESIWIRRNGFSLNNVLINESQLQNNVFFDDENYHKKHISMEMNVLISYFHTLIKNNCQRTLGSYAYGDVNKMDVLEAAKNLGLKIPKSYIVSSRQQLSDLYRKHPYLLTKALGIGVYLFKEKYSYYSYSERITAESIENLPEYFFPSLIQTEIKKKYELRVFYLKGNFYAMAVFSQRYVETTVDFRKQNSEKPLRTVPFQLPELIKSQLLDLMKELHLDTGSIDIIVDDNNEYIFLEVNPVGQFSMTSHPCNYYLEKKIAELL